MTIEEIKKDLKEHIGKEAMIKYSLGRNKYESYHVRVKELYEYIFLVELCRCYYKNNKNWLLRKNRKTLAFLVNLLYTENVNYTEGRD